eukprot:GHVU01099155.1.p3 GENE.GHVU01099155.1~~GHVU01099155.1.p3  ORF type:complete len:101 (+),score=11.30 GHVU01099155.1:456-758(+)
MFVCECVYAAYLYPEEEHLLNTSSDLLFFAPLMEQDEINDPRFGPAARRRRNQDAHRFRHADDVVVDVDHRIEGTCVTLLFEWFERNIFNTHEIPQANEE